MYDGKRGANDPVNYFGYMLRVPYGTRTYMPGVGNYPAIFLFLPSNVQTTSVKRRSLNFFPETRKNNNRGGLLGKNLTHGI